MSRRNAARDAIGSFLRRFLHVYWRFSRGMTLGVRALVIEAFESPLPLRERSAENEQAEHGRDNRTANEKVGKLHIPGRAACLLGVVRFRVEAVIRRHRVIDF